MIAADSPNDTRAIVMQFFGRLRARDVDGVAALFADSIDWFIPGNQALAPWLGRRTRRAELGEFFRTLSDNIEPLGFHLEHVLVDGNFAVAVGTFASRMRRTGKTIESMFAIQFTVRDGAIVRYRLLEDSYAVVVALTG